MTGAFQWHGGRLDEARARYGEGTLPWLDLSTGINPCPWPGAGALHIDWQSLPAPSALNALEAAAAHHFGVDPALCCALPGSEMGLRLLGRLIDLPGRYCPPCYRTHGEIFADSRVSGTGDAPERTALVLANPNNPDGRQFTPASLRERLEMQQSAGGWLVVDEAFADASPDISIAGDVGGERNLVVMRSFGKFFGLAGVRLGFAIAPPPIIAALRRLLGDWPVSAAAIEIGTRAYRDRDWIDTARAALPRRAAEMDAMLARRGLVATGASPLFRLIDHAQPRSLFDHLCRRQILTRPFADHPHWLRLGLPADRAALDRLDRALADG